jgi:lysozyme family protein
VSLMDYISNRINREVLVRLAGLKRKLDDMAEREDAAYARQAELIQSVKDGWAAREARIAALEEALANADADKAAALEADSQADAERVEGANAALDELLNPPAPEEPQA